MTRIAAAVARIPAGVLSDLRLRYAEPWRGYHDWLHIEELLRQLEVADEETPFADIDATVAAALFHDAVLVPLAHDNEAASAELALRVLAAAMPTVDRERAARLIRLTADHGKLEPDHVDEDEARFLDADLAIVASAPERYAQYERGVAREYAALPPEVFAEGRRAFLRGLRDKPVLFLSASFHRRLDAAARVNLERALARS